MMDDDFLEMKAEKKVEGDEEPEEAASLGV